MKARRNLFDAGVARVPLASPAFRPLLAFRRDEDREDARGRVDDLACTKSTKLNFAPLAHAIYEPWLYDGRDGGREVSLSNGV